MQIALTKAEPSDQSTERRDGTVNRALYKTIVNTLKENPGVWFSLDAQDIESRLPGVPYRRDMLLAYLVKQTLGRIRTRIEGSKIYLFLEVDRG